MITPAVGLPHLQRPAPPRVLVALARRVLDLVTGSLGHPGRAAVAEHAVVDGADPAVIRIQWGLANVCAVVRALPLDVYRLTIRDGEIEIYDRRRRTYDLAWPGDWLVRRPDGAWQVVEQDAFTPQYRPLPTTATDRTSRA